MDKTEMDAIMQERIENFNNFVMSLDIDKIPIGLFSGKMGICIYFYHQAHLSENKIYEKFAGRLLDSICDQVHIGTPVDFENGLLGICFGINYLINEKFITGNINSIVKEMEDRIYHLFCFNILKNKSNTQAGNQLVLELSFYLCQRLENEKLSKCERYLFENMIIKSINKIEESTSFEKFSEPIIFSIFNYFLPNYLFLLDRVHKLNFYNNKIEKIIDELSYKLKSTYPLLKSNRLFLSEGMKSVEHIKKYSGWKEHILLLEKDADFDSIIKEEFRNKNIFMIDGITGFYFLIKKSKGYSKVNLDMLAQKITLSDVWNEYIYDREKLKTQIGLVNGFCAVMLAYEDFLK